MEDKQTQLLLEAQTAKDKLLAFDDKLKWLIGIVESERHTTAG